MGLWKWKMWFCPDWRSWENKDTFPHCKHICTFISACVVYPQVHSSYLRSCDIGHDSIWKEELVPFTFSYLFSFFHFFLPRAENSIRQLFRIFFSALAVGVTSSISFLKFFLYCELNPEEPNIGDIRILDFTRNSLFPFPCLRYNFLMRAWPNFDLRGLDREKMAGNYRTGYVFLLLLLTSMRRSKFLLVVFT